LLLGFFFENLAVFDEEKIGWLVFLGKVGDEAPLIGKVLLFQGRFVFVAGTVFQEGRRGIEGISLEVLDFGHLERALSLHACLLGMKLAYLLHPPIVRRLRFLGVVVRVELVPLVARAIVVDLQIFFFIVLAIGVEILPSGDSNFGRAVRGGLILLAVNQWACTIHDWSIQNYF